VFTKSQLTASMFIHNFSIRKINPIFVSGREACESRGLNSRHIKTKITSKVLEKPAVFSYEELGGLSDPGPRGCVHNVV
jgi:hypothetical protein